MKAQHLLSKSFLFAAPAFAVLAATGAQAQLVNGDFSDPGSLSVNNVATVIPSGTSSTLLPGWTATVGDGANSNVYLFTNNPDANNPKAFFLPNPLSGFKYAVQLDGSVGHGEQPFTLGSSLAQSFSLAPGSYQLSFWLNNEVGQLDGVPKGGTSGALVNLTGAGLLSGGLVSQEYTVTNPDGVSRADSVWKQVTTNFSVAAGNQLTLSFYDDANPNLANFQRSSNVALADVSIAPVPEPASFALAGVGAVSLVGLQALKRRRV